MKKYTVNVLVFFTFFCCKNHEDIKINSDDYHAVVDYVTEVMVHDIFSPPVASRIYVYPNIAAHEILAVNNTDMATLSDVIVHLNAIPKPKDTLNINYKLAALVAHMELSKRLIFSEQKMETFRDSLYQKWEYLNPNQFDTSKTYGLEVAEFVGQWMDMDNYKETRTMPKFSVFSDDPSRWQPTPPAYMDGIEPHWMKIRTFLLDSSDQFKPLPPPVFSLDKATTFYKELEEVYSISKEITKKGDDSEEVKIAQFWDCNPYVSITRGHLMFAKKKITPGAHWIGITKIASRKSDFSFEQTVNAYTKTSIGIFEAFISCWDEKYRSNLIRPETLINEHIDDSWEPILQTPPFPEYTSGHSVVSGSASKILTALFGDNFQFDDDTELPYGLPIRSFNSFTEAAQEAAVSRLYGGIHYRAAVEIGLEQGQQLGAYVTEKLKIN